MKDQFKSYWERSVPWSFKDENLKYEEKREMRYSLQSYMHDVIPFDKCKGKRVLEIGCGGGIDVAEFARNGAIVHAIDFTDTAVSITTKLLKEADLKATVQKAPATKIPYPDNWFDCVYSFGVLHHIPDIEGVLSEISRVIKPDGEVIVMLYNKNSLLYAYSILFLHRNEGLSEDELVRRYSERILDCPYTKVYTKDEARALFTKYFTDVNVSVHYNVIDLPEKRKVKIDVPDEYELGWHLIVKASHKKAKCDQKIT